MTVDKLAMSQIDDALCKKTENTEVFTIGCDINWTETSRSESNTVFDKRQVIVTVKKETYHAGCNLHIASKYSKCDDSTCECAIFALYYTHFNRKDMNLEDFNLDQMLILRF
jgi:hypothetical protein